MAATEAPVFPDATIETTTPSSTTTATATTQSASYNLYDWKPVTKEFMEACKDLELGELLHDETFGLFEAMSAIEMMDPKMDAGMPRVGQMKRRKPTNFAEAVKAGKLPMENLPLRDLVAVVDHTMACLVTWLEGHSLAQTVFTNLYLHCGDDPEKRSPQQELRSFTVATLKLIDLVRDLIAKASVFEEEDFQPLIYGFQLASDVPGLKAMSGLKETEDSMQKRMRAVKQDPDCDEYREAMAVCCRAKFSRHFYLALTFLIKADVGEAVKHLANAKDQLEAIRSTIGVGTPANPEDGTVLGFEPTVNQRLLPPTFPRYTEIRGREAAYSYLGSLIERVHEAIKISEVHTFHNALEFFIAFGRNSPCVLSRSVSQLLFKPLHPSPQNQPLRPSAPLPAFQVSVNNSGLFSRVFSIFIFILRNC